MEFDSNYQLKDKIYNELLAHVITFSYDLNSLLYAVLYTLLSMNKI